MGYNFGGATDQQPPATQPPAPLRLLLPPSLTPTTATDEKRVRTLRKFQDATPGFGASGVQQQTFVISADKLEAFCAGGLRESADLPQEVRFMRLFLLLLIGGDDWLDNYLETGRFRGVNPGSKLTGAFGSLVAHNLAHEEEAQARGDAAPTAAAAAARLEALRRLDTAANPPPPWVVRQLRQLVEQGGGRLRPRSVALLIAALAALVAVIVALVAPQLSAPAACRRHDAPAVSAGGIRRTLTAAMSDNPHLSPRLIESDPPIIVFEDFLSAAEAARLVELCAAHFAAGATGAQLETTSSYRTSQVCFCTAEADGCINDPVVAAVRARAANLTRTPPGNAEPMQMLKYGASQRYKTHHDSVHAPDTLQGARLYTLLMYLSTPAHGGGTRFNDLPGEAVVAPVTGRAVLWPNAMDADPSIPELRTHHEAEPVTDGVKLAANLWIHQHAFRAPLEAGCHKQMGLDAYSALVHPYHPDAELQRYQRARRAAALDADVPASMRRSRAETHTTEERAAFEAAARTARWWSLGRKVLLCGTPLVVFCVGRWMLWW